MAISLSVAPNISNRASGARLSQASIQLELDLHHYISPLCPRKTQLSAYHEPHLHPSASTANQPTTEQRTLVLSSTPPPPPSAIASASHLDPALKATPFFFCARPLKKNYYKRQLLFLLWPIEQNHCNLFATAEVSR